VIRELRAISTSLSKLDLSFNLLTSVPSDVFNFPLSSLCLASNQLMTLPDALAQLPLVTLDLSSNFLAQLPAVLPLSLEHLSLDENGLLKVLPPSITSLKRLECLALTLTALPEEFRKNAFSREAVRTLTNQIVAAQKTKSFINQSLTEKGIEERLEPLGPAERLLVEDLLFNFNLMSFLPPSIAEFGNLQTLELADNHLRGLPGFLTHSFPNLKVLDISSNQIDAIPTTVGKLTKLKRLFLNDNPIKRLPESLTRLESLEIFTLKNTLIPHQFQKNIFNNHSAVLALLEGVLEVQEKEGLFQKNELFTVDLNSENRIASELKMSNQRIQVDLDESCHSSEETGAEAKAETAKFEVVEEFEKDEEDEDDDQTTETSSEEEAAELQEMREQKETKQDERKEEKEVEEKVEMFDLKEEEPGEEIVIDHDLIEKSINDTSAQIDNWMRSNSSMSLLEKETEEEEEEKAEEAKVEAEQKQEEGEEEEEEEEKVDTKWVEELAVNEDDVEMVVAQCSCTKEEALAALQMNNNDPIEAIMSMGGM
jgi:Leucine-rich repeat (LRR) protein